MNEKWHRLKIYPWYFICVRSGKKNFEIRKNDRDYTVGDFLILEEFDKGTGEYTGKALTRFIEYILYESPGLEPGFVIIGMRKI